MSITATTNPIDSLQEQYGSDVTPQRACDGIPTFWAPQERVREVLGYLKAKIDRPYAMLYDLTAIDEQDADQPAGVAAVRFHGRLSLALLRAQ